MCGLGNGAFDGYQIVSRAAVDAGATYRAEAWVRPWDGDAGTVGTIECAFIVYDKDAGQHRTTTQTKLENGWQKIGCAVTVESPNAATLEFAVSTQQKSTGCFVFDDAYVGRVK